MGEWVVFTDILECRRFDFFDLIETAQNGRRRFKFVFLNFSRLPGILSLAQAENQAHRDLERFFADLKSSRIQKLRKLARVFGFVELHDLRALACYRVVAEIFPLKARPLETFLKINISFQQACCLVLDVKELKSYVVARQILPDVIDHDFEGIVHLLRFDRRDVPNEHALHGRSRVINVEAH